MSKETMLSSGPNLMDSSFRRTSSVDVSMLAHGTLSKCSNRSQMFISSKCTERSREKAQEIGCMAQKESSATFELNFEQFVKMNLPDAFEKAKENYLR